MDFNNGEFTRFRADFRKAVEELEKKYDIKISDGNITYTDTEFRFKVTAIKKYSYTPQPKGEGLTRGDLKLGDQVNIMHPKMDPNKVFTVIKINRVKVKVKNESGIYNVPLSLLKKVK